MYTLAQYSGGNPGHKRKTSPTPSTAASVSSPIPANPSYPATATQTFFSTEPLTKLVLTAGGVKYGMEISVEIRTIQSAWAQYEDETSLVVGNETSSGGIAKRYMGYDASF
jgi:hypothetical protein